MAAPDYVPVQLEDHPRPTERMPPARPWRSDRPGDLPGRQPVGPKLGRPGPDQGYVLTLVRRFQERLRLKEGERADDAIAGCVAVALERASLLGRAPVVYDLEFAFTLFGFLGDPPEDLVAFRKKLFEGAAHHYWVHREIVDRVLEETLRLAPAQVRGRQAEWRTLIDAG